MSRPARLSRAALAEKLTPVFQRYGYEGASLTLLASAVGLSKASLYHHFPAGKADMAAYALAHAGARLQKLVLAPLASKAPAWDRLAASMDGAEQYYDGAVPVCLMNSLLLGEGQALFGARIKQAVDAWMAGLAKIQRDIGMEDKAAAVWAQMALERLQGALVLCRVQGSRAALEHCLHAMRQL